MAWDKEVAMGRAVVSEKCKEFIAGLPPALTRRGPEASSRVEVAKRIRLELARGIDAGLFPQGSGFSVRAGSGSGIDIDVIAWVGAVFTDEYTAVLMDGDDDSVSRMWKDRVAPELAQVLSDVEALANRHNFDESDLMTDYFHVGYYLTVTSNTVEAVAKRGIAMERDPSAADRLIAAERAAKLVGPKAAKAILGRRGLAGACEYTLKQLLRMAERVGPSGKPLVYDRKRGSWVAQ